MASSANVLSVNNTIEPLSPNGSNNTSSGGFEGPEKLLELWFAFDDDVLADGGLRVIEEPIWSDVLSHAHCSILSVRHSLPCDIYLLSESSLFVFPDRLIIKTCGSTTLLACIDAIYDSVRVHVLGCDVSDNGTTLDFGQRGVPPPATRDRELVVNYLFYSRKQFLFPELQPHPHTNWSNEVEFLNDSLARHFREPIKGHVAPNSPSSRLASSAYVVGDVSETGDHWCFFVAHLPDNETTKTDPLSSTIVSGESSNAINYTRNPDTTLEVMMSHLDPQQAKIFWNKNMLPNASPLRSKTSNVTLDSQKSNGNFDSMSTTLSSDYEYDPNGDDNDAERTSTGDENKDDIDCSGSHSGAENLLSDGDSTYCDPSAYADDVAYAETSKPDWKNTPSVSSSIDENSYDVDGEIRTVVSNKDTPQRIFIESQMVNVFDGIFPDDGTGKAPYKLEVIDHHLFDPCGYSLNGIVSRGPHVSQHYYFTVHVTPEEHCSYASFETNVVFDNAQQVEKLIGNVCSIFKPAKFSTTMFHSSSSSDCVPDSPIPGPPPMSRTDSVYGLPTPARSQESISDTKDAITEYVLDLLATQGINNEDQRNEMYATVSKKLESLLAPATNLVTEIVHNSPPTKNLGICHKKWDIPLIDRIPPASEPKQNDSTRYFKRYKCLDWIRHSLVDEKWDLVFTRYEI